jgi:predicted  nucleic acid-binding Zn-ribbon protein
VTAVPILVELARRDARLYGLRQQIANLPRRIQDLGAQRAKLELQFREVEGRLQQSESARRKLEGELTEYRQRKAKSESRLATLTSTEQYQALVKEIATHAAHIDELESQILEAMDRSEQVQRQVDAERVRVQQAVGVLEEQQRSLQADLEAARASLPEDSRARDGFLAQVDAPTRAAYDRILRAKGDAALALVAGQSCGICKAVQPPQVLQALRQGGGATRTCQMCGRILVWDGEST